MNTYDNKFKKQAVEYVKEHTDLSVREYPYNLGLMPTPFTTDFIKIKKMNSSEVLEIINLMKLKKSLV